MHGEPIVGAVTLCMRCGAMKLGGMWTVPLAKQVNEFPDGAGWAFEIPPDCTVCENTIAPAVARESQVYSGRISVETETAMGARFRFTPPVTMY